jgi:hypothetical protein
MMTSIEIKLIANDQIFSIIPLLQTLNPAISETVLQDRRCFGRRKATKKLATIIKKPLTSLKLHIENAPNCKTL